MALPGRFTWVSEDAPAKGYSDPRSERAQGGWAFHHLDLAPSHARSISFRKT